MGKRKRSNTTPAAGTVVKQSDPLPAAKTAAAPDATLSKSAKRRRKRKEQKLKQAQTGAKSSPTPAPSSVTAKQNAPNSFKPPAKKKGKMSLTEKFRAKLSGGQFRWLNEQLYTSTSDKAFELFQKDNSLFDVYHSGFASQVDKWPENPVDVMIRELKAHKGWEVADFGCGEARIAQTLHKTHKIHSYDLVAANPFITACNIANVPLPDGQCDAAVFCLSLMGVDYIRFLQEAHRVLKTGGTLLVAEVKSRFAGESSEDKADTNTAMRVGIKQFVADLVGTGFDLHHKDLSNPMFVLFKFTKSTRAPVAKAVKNKATLKSCRYKKR